jgi:uncharacterized protein YjbI with pentapeptide repeats
METQSFETTRQNVYKLVQEAKPIDEKIFDEKCLQHLKFLEKGGAGGHWDTFYITDLIFGTYRHEGDAPKDLQASFVFFNLSDMRLSGMRLPYSNCATIHCQAADWSHADLEGTLFIDSILNSCSFEYADLTSADFSRSEMKYCSFRGANLHNTDFENCDLTGADFEFAHIDETTKFKGANLTNAKMPRQ